MKYSIHSMLYPSLVDAADFNKNNRMNILVTIRYRKNRRIFVGNHSETFLNQSPYSFDTNSSVLSIALGGFNPFNPDVFLRSARAEKKKEKFTLSCVLMFQSAVLQIDRHLS